jgi:hypothetical protein
VAVSLYYNQTPKSWKPKIKTAIAVTLTATARTAPAAPIVRARDAHADVLAAVKTKTPLGERGFSVLNLVLTVLLSNQ